MPRSKSRSLGEKKVHHRSSSVFARSLSSTIFCRGDSIWSQIDPKALIKSNDKSNSHADSSENGIDATSVVVIELEDELRRTKEKLSVSELEKQRIEEELREAKALAGEPNSRSRSSSEEREDLMDEIEGLKKALSEKDKRIESLQMEVGRWTKLEAALAEKDEFIDRLNKELRELRDREKGSMALVSDCKRRVEELEGEVKRRKESELKMSEALASNKREFESVELELQETKTEMKTLRDKIGTLESLSKHSETSSDDDDDDDDDEVRDLKAKLKSAKERESKALLRVEALEDEMDFLKTEWRQALSADQQSSKAMEDLGLALAEVAAEAKQANENFNEAENELERVWNLVKEAQQEAEMHKNTKEKLRLEVEETLMAWTAKEMSFLSCVKNAEEERAAAVQESNRLSAVLVSAEKMARSAKDESHKLRDLLKQALNEANAGKAAASLARDENSNLKDSLAEKEETLHFFMEENERLRISEATMQETIRKLKKKLSKSSSSDIYIGSKELHETAQSEVSSDDAHKENHKGKNKDKDNTEDDEENMSEGVTFNLNGLKVMTEPDELQLSLLDEDPEKAEALKGSIFDMSAVTPKSEPQTPTRSLSKKHRRRYSFSYTEIKEGPNSEAFYTSEYDYPIDPIESIESKPTHRRVTTMFRRVGGLLALKRGPSRKEALPLPSNSPSQSSVD